MCKKSRNGVQEHLILNYLHVLSKILLQNGLFFKPLIKLDLSPELYNVVDLNKSLLKGTKKLSIYSGETTVLKIHCESCKIQ